MIFIGKIKFLNLPILIDCGGIYMNNKIANPSIKCSVVQCKNHCGNENYCTLDTIKVGTHEQNPTVVQCTDCESFIAKNNISNN